MNPIEFQPMRELPLADQYDSNDVLVIFGELFSRGYVNGLIEEAQRRKMKIIYSTVGRRDDNDQLRPLNSEELKEKGHDLINIPLEAGFDLEADSSGQRPIDYMKSVRLSEWADVKLDFSRIEESRNAALKDFRLRIKSYMDVLEKQISPSANVLFAHTMAGGIPRAKIIMPVMNRVFKGFGDRYSSSEELWKTDMGKLCALSFDEVTAQTLHHLIDLSQPLRDRQIAKGKKVSYVAYGYHGTDIFTEKNGKPHYHWQSYSPYLQGWAKIELENIARKAFSNKISATVFNAPEILTNSSSVFLGVEVCLYALVGALRAEGPNHPLTKDVLSTSKKLLKPEHSVDEILKFIKDYVDSEVIRQWTKFDIWPQHNGPEQMRALREASQKIISMHQSEKQLLTATLSEIVFRSTGSIMLRESWAPRSPVWWIGHDAVAKEAVGNSLPL